MARRRPKPVQATVAGVELRLSVPSWTLLAALIREDAAVESSPRDSRTVASLHRRGMLRRVHVPGTLGPCFAPTDLARAFYGAVSERRRREQEARGRRAARLLRGGADAAP